jgi:hypothetical protein
MLKGGSKMCCGTGIGVSCGELLRHCERSEAIHLAAIQSWIAWSQVLLAMTRKFVVFWIV